MRYWLLFALVSTTAFGQSMRYRIDRFVKDRDTLQRFHETRLSEAGMERMLAFYARAQADLQKLDFDAMSRADRVDWILLDHSLRDAVRRIELRRERLVEDAPFLAFTAPVVKLDAQRRAREPVDERALARAVASVNEAVKQSRKALEQRQKEPKAEAEAEGEGEAGETRPEKLPKWRLHELAGLAKAAEKILNDWYAHYAAYRPGFDWWLKKPVEEAKRELSEYDKWVREKLSGVKDRANGPPFGEVVGAERLREQLDLEMIPYSVDELIARAEKEFAWCREQMQVAARELGIEQPRDALEHVKDQFVAPGDQEDYVVEQARDAIRFCDEHKLLTVPKLCRETWRVKMVDEKGQKTLPYAAYGGLNVMVAYATGSMSHEKKLMSMRGNNLHTTRIVTAHEVIPGHHLQSYYLSRHRPHRGLFRTPFNIEGWCLYWELRLWEMDFARGPEDRIGFLFWRMHRCARIIVTLKFHTGRMQPNEMIDFLVDDVGHEREQATAEVRRFIRGNYSPLYQAGYMLGGMQFHSLHRQLVTEGDWSEKQFHDAVLKLGPIPVEMVRASLIEEVELTRDFRTRWKF